MEEEDALTTPVLPWLAVIITLVVGLAWARPLTMPQLSGVAMAGPLAAYLLAELASPSLAGFGRFPLSATALLVTVGCPAMGRVPWLFVIALGGMVRSVRCLLRREPILSVLGDALPELWAGLAAWVVPPAFSAAAAALVYLLGWQLLPGLFASAVSSQRLHLWSLARERSLATATFLGLLGASLAGVLVFHSGSVLVALAAIPFLSVPVRAQLRVLEAESKTRDQERLGRAQERTSSQLAELQTQVDLQRVDVELQHRVLTLVGELFMETALIQSPADLRPALLSFIRRVIPGQRVTLFEQVGEVLTASAGFGPPEMEPSASTLETLAADRVKPVQVQERTCSHLAAYIPQRGLLVVSDPEPRWQAEHRHLLHRLAYHLPLCLDAVRYREFQSRALEDEQTRRQELDRLAARLTACLDLLGQLVSCRSTDELVKTAQNRLPDLIPGYRAQVVWREQNFSPVASDVAPKYSLPLYAGQMGEGQLNLFSRGGNSLTILDTELLNLFSIQFACLLEGAELNTRLRKALEQVKTSQAQVVQSSKMAAIGQLAAGGGIDRRRTFH